MRTTTLRYPCKNAEDIDPGSEKELCPGESRNQLLSKTAPNESHKQGHRQSVKGCQSSRCDKRPGKHCNEPSYHFPVVQPSRCENPWNEQIAKRFQCFKCSGYNHIARNCPSRRIPSYRGDSQPWLRSAQSMPANLHLYGGTSNHSDRCNSVNKSPHIQRSKSDTVFHTSVNGPSNMANHTGQLCSSYSLQSPFPLDTQYTTGVEHQQTSNATTFVPPGQSPVNHDFNRIGATL